MYKPIGFLLHWENTLNLVGGALFHLSNHHYNFYENKPGLYFDFWCGGWNLNPCAKGYLQFCPNVNFARGILWGFILIAQIILIEPKKEKLENMLNKRATIEKDERDNISSFYFFPYYQYTSVILASTKFVARGSGLISLIIFILQDLISLPLTIHFTPTFSLSIAIDSIIWMGVTRFVNKGNWKKEVDNAREKVNNIMNTKALIND